MFEPESVSTEGGAVVHGDVSSGTFIGRDQIIVLSGYSQAQLEQALDGMVHMLQQPGTSIRFAEGEGRRTMSLASEGTGATVSLEAAMALSSMVARNQASYLASMIVSPVLRRWGTQFVPLSGTLTVVQDPSGMLEVHPEFSILHARGEGAERRVFRERVPDISTVARRYNTFVVLGEPGAGKTTVLCKLALEAAETRLRTGAGRLPLLVTLADYRDYTDPYAFVADQARQRLGDSVSVHDLLARGELLLLVDSLNEMPRTGDQEFRGKIRAWRDFVNRWPENQFIFSCRQRDYSEPLGVQQVEIDPLDDARIRLFLEQYLGDESAESFWTRITAGRDNLVSLARNPYLLTMLTAIYLFEGDLPTNRALLFTNFIEVLFRRESSKGHADWPPQTVLFTALAQLAWSMLASGEGTKLSYSAMAQLLRHQVDAPPDSGYTPSDVIIQLGLATSLLESHAGAEGEEEIFFYHHLLQEAMAAREMLRRWRSGQDLTPQVAVARLAVDMPDAGPLGPNEPLPPPPSSGWEETTILAAGLAQDATAFIESVRGVNPVLAARCVLEAGVATTDSLRSLLVADLQREMSDPAVHLRARIMAGNVLGELGDGRFEQLTVDDRPVCLGRLVEVPGGKARNGSTGRVTRQLAREGHGFGKEEEPRHLVRLTAYRIGVHPVTNGEYRRFVEDDGYRKSGCWTEAGRAWLRGENPGGGPEAEFLNLRRHLSVDPSTVARWQQTPGASKEIAGWRALVSESDQRAIDELEDYYARRSRTRPAFWEDERYGRANHPVVGVTWYEAMAYCAWLTVQLKLAGRLARGHAVRLASEAEWEHAAKGFGSPAYPWGRKGDSRFANTREGRVLGPTPVGTYAVTRSPFGCADMAGNVWEWTHSLHRPYPYDPADGREDENGHGYRVVRGSSWIDPQLYGRCAYRGRHPPDFFDYDQGFRVVVAERPE
ncbi:SUMF1/EgtB/PvdO family nonheme iron enzyme [Streptomyces sp. NBC_00083]|uniref:SUMF1/EgtB/PvdO family nonheme iron enzyme n=1 Tax=Streptomyces sp. NBC_00083 TaxID=2975647 RepID=UPI00224F7111|nr:SUMF1/EgtB/PvdO family nonheme iron enzyme [Streptomyces sp. NBC_00083]MCX5386865.1 SUMF1/EgtB/PvdO family nonheme iron enzyme [Streptomyces sp. NBC_00083]